MKFTSVEFEFNFSDAVTQQKSCFRIQSSENSTKKVIPLWLHSRQDLWLAPPAVFEHG
ncbi:hypothetical protein [Pseudoflavonifractor phocaeensis]|uniref:hypothetical protein n=1 Tax=Pseudoflavonifractor phocaeensis TaxID=1870988 RepID=UPI00195E7234|nr:hypothetical protein [Pseudoflavonifractor phocaeensis]